MAQDLDTLLPLEYDSLIALGDHLFGKKNGQWFSCELQVVKDSLVYTPKPFPVDSWYEDGDFLYYFHQGKTGLFSKTFQENYRLNTGLCNLFTITINYRDSIISWFPMVNISDLRI